MSQPKQEGQTSSLSPQDVLLVLFKHKGKILLCAALGIAAAAAVYFLNTPLYESKAKLLVRYVVDRSAIDPEIAERKGGLGDAINSEVQIFTSWDLAMHAAEAIGSKRLLPEAEKATAAAAAGSIRAGLTVATATKGGNVIVLSYQNRDPQLTTLVLNELISQYFVKHLDVHRSAEAFNFVAQQSDQVKARLNQTEEELKRIKAKAGVVSLAESTALINAELSSSQNALQSAKAEYAEQSARVEEMEKSLAAQDKDTPAATPPAINNEAVQKYRALIGQLDNLRHVQMELLAKYSEKAGQPVVPEIQRTRQVRSLDQRAQDKRGQDLVAAGRALRLGFVGAERDMAQAMARERYRQQNATGFDYQAGKKDFDTLVKEAEDEILGKRATTSQADKDSQLELVRINQMQIENLEQQRSDLEKRYPETVAAATAGLSSPSNQSNLLGERARLAGIEARTRALESHLSQVKKRAEQLAEVGPQIAQLERAKEIEENNYKYFQASLEKARVDEALDPSKIPNISVVQKPSPAMRATQDLKKIVLGLAGGGVALGLGLAFLIELILDRTVRRPAELEKLLGTPILLSIPYLNGRNPLRLRSALAREKSIILRRESNVAPWEEDHFIRPYSEAIRDRLVLFFELNRMNHKPKLVAVTGCSEGAGASTLAGGIAAALSETGDGKVLLVDMNVGRPEIHPFFRGAPACSLTEALVGEPAQAGENLYLATATQPDAQQAQLIPRRFYDLMPHLKASDFDYIIFDMPPFSQTSITLPMSRFMDKVIIVAEAEKSSRDVVKRAKTELASVGPSISVILNKVRLYAPKWVGAEG